MYYKPLLIFKCLLLSGKRVTPSFASGAMLLKEAVTATLLHYCTKLAIFVVV